jgi:uncharacterized protein (DUF1501 family)
MLPGHSDDRLTRRRFLRASAASAGAMGLALANRARGNTRDGSQEARCILLLLVGGPSHLDTWDPKPEAPESVRGPFRPIATRVPGLQICEHFPLMARLADRFAIFRSVHHDQAPIHETGHQLMQTGSLHGGNVEYPHFGSVVSHLLGRTRADVPPFVVLPGPLGSTGVDVSHGQTAGFLGADHEPVYCRPDARERPVLCERYGRNRFGQSCLRARQLIEKGVRLVTVNMFDTVFNQVTWDCHADGVSLTSRLDDYRQTLCPMFDRAYTALLEDLDQRGLLEQTLVVAMGEFGRTPRLNRRGGRDHWPGCWSILFAGSGVRGGQVIGCSDAIGSEPRDRPITPAEVAASIYWSLRIDPQTPLQGPGGQSYPLAAGEPIAELFGA